MMNVSQRGRVEAGSGTNLVVEKEKGLLVVLGQSRDDKHALAGLVVSRLGDGDLRARETTDLVDLGAGAADDASAVG